MNERERCTRCILPKSLPSVKLDTNGVCNHCKTYDRVYSNWEEVETPKKINQFEQLLQRAKRLNNDSDCLIALSGGKDSTYALYLCAKVYGLKCLCVTFDNCFLSEYAKTNIKNAIKATNADHKFYRINHHLMLKLYKTFIAKTGDFCSACMRGIEQSKKIAEYYKIPLIIDGGGRRTTYLSFHPEVFQNGDEDYFKNVIKGEPIEKSAIQMSRESLSWKFNCGVTQACRLLKVPNPILRQHQVHLYDYIYTPVDRIINILSKEMGWKKPVDETEHIDCTLQGIYSYGLSLKFPEITATTFHHIGKIRLGEMTREEAMTIEQEKLGNIQIPRELDSFLSEIGMSRDEFESSMRNWRNKEKFLPKNKNIFISAYSRMARI